MNPTLCNCRQWRGAGELFQSPFALDHGQLLLHCVCLVPCSALSWLFHTIACPPTIDMFLRKVIHNEAIKNDPVEIYGWRVYYLACSACWGGLIFGMDIGR